MSAKELLFQLYKKFYEQRSVLNDAPALTLDIEHQNADTFDEKQANSELNALVSYMMGSKDVRQLSWNDTLNLLEKYYGNQPQWQKLLLDYFSYTLESEKEDLARQQLSFFQEIVKQFDEGSDQEQKIPM